MKELDSGLFSVLIDEARDVSTKEQMAVVLRFVNKKGSVVERFLGLKKGCKYYINTLKNALDEVFSQHSLSISMLRGQGYDGASNMRGEYNGLKALILKENESAHFIHYFSHQLQLALVAVAKNHTLVNGTVFYLISEIVNTVGGSCKKKDMLREAQANRIIEHLSNEEIVSGQGLNQESDISRPGDTRWGSHYKTLCSLINLFGPVVDVLDTIVEDGLLPDQKFVAYRLLNSIQSFEFVFLLHMMADVLGITNDLSQALQRKDQDIENAMRLVNISKKRLQKMRDDGWNSLVEQVSTFCEKNVISVPSMDDAYVVTGKSKCRVEQMTNFHHFHVELFNTVINMQFQELNYRFNESNTELLLCIACLNPHDCFASFDIEKLIRLTKFYPNDFSHFDLSSIPNQLENFVMDMRSNVDFVNIKGLSDVTRMMVDSIRDLTYPLVYRLLTLALILPVATATVERAFSGMKIVKTRLRNRNCDILYYNLELARMWLNLKRVVSKWPGVIKVINKSRPGDGTYILVGEDEQLGAMWLGGINGPVEVRYLGKLPDGRFASYRIMSIWDNGHYYLNWKFAVDDITYAQHVDGSHAFDLVFDTFKDDNIKFTVHLPNDSFDSDKTKEVPNTNVSHKIAGPA